MDKEEYKSKLLDELQKIEILKFDGIGEGELKFLYQYDEWGTFINAISDDGKMKVEALEELQDEGKITYQIKKYNMVATEHAVGEAPDLPFPDPNFKPYIIKLKQWME